MMGIIWAERVRGTYIKDCLSCGHSYITTARLGKFDGIEDYNEFKDLPVLVCGYDENNHKEVDESYCCENYN